MTDTCRLEGNFFAKGAWSTLVKAVQSWSKYLWQACQGGDGGELQGQLLKFIRQLQIFGPGSPYNQDQTQAEIHKAHRGIFLPS